MATPKDLTEPVKVKFIRQMVKAMPMQSTEEVLAAKPNLITTKRKGASTVIKIAVELILFATIGFVGLQLLATASTTSFQTTVVLVAITVVSIVAALGVALSFLKHAGFSI